MLSIAGRAVSMGAAFKAFSDYHVPNAERLVREAGTRTMAAGLVAGP